MRSRSPDPLGQVRNIRPIKGSLVQEIEKGEVLYER